MSSDPLDADDARLARAFGLPAPAPVAYYHSNLFHSQAPPVSAFDNIFGRFLLS